jgi:hypothetical protein
MVLSLGKKTALLLPATRQKYQGVITRKLQFRFIPYHIGLRYAIHYRRKDKSFFVILQQPVEFITYFFVFLHELLIFAA